MQMSKRVTAKSLEAKLYNQSKHLQILANVAFSSLKREVKCTKNQYTPYGSCTDCPVNNDCGQVDWVIKA